MGLAQQLSFDEAPQFAARPWQLGNTEQTRLVVAVQAVDSYMPDATEHFAVQVVQLDAPAALYAPAAQELHDDAPAAA